LITAAAQASPHMMQTIKGVGEQVGHQTAVPARTGTRGKQKPRQNRNHGLGEGEVRDQRRTEPETDAPWRVNEIGRTMPVEPEDLFEMANLYHVRWGFADDGWVLQHPRGKATWESPGRGG